MGSYVIFKEGEYIFGLPEFSFLKILHLLDSVCGLACNTVTILGLYL